MLFGREMRLPLDVMYRPPEGTYMKYDYPSEVRKTLTDAYERARQRLHLAHKRRKDYYDRRTCGSRFFPNSLVWLWSPVVEKGVAPKFHEPWTGPYKVIKRLSDITYEIHDEAKNKTKIVHFDRLKKAILSLVKLDQSDNESDQPSENDSDAAFEIVIAPRQLVPRKPIAPAVAPQAQPEAAAAKVKPNQSQPANGADFIQPIVEQRHAAEAPAVIAKPAHSVPAADEQAAAPTRVSGGSNKGKPPRRYSPPSSSRISTIAFTFLLLLFLAALANAQDVIVLPKHGAVAEKIGEVAVDLGSAQFPMVFHLVIHDTVHNNGHSCFH